MYVNSDLLVQPLKIIKLRAAKIKGSSVLLTEHKRVAT